jgi:putative oxidoreductase
MSTHTERAGILAALIDRVIRLLDAIPYALVALFARIVVAHAFFASGQTKVEGPVIGGEVAGLDLTVIIPTHIRDSAFTLFAEEYKVPVLPSGLSTYLATFAEHLLPVLLFLGLASRFSALGLIGMTTVIQIFVYRDAWWTVHAYWLGLLLVIVAQGPGALSLDHLIARSWRSRNCGVEGFRSRPAAI